MPVMQSPGGCRPRDRTCTVLLAGALLIIPLLTAMTLVNVWVAPVAKAASADIEEPALTVSVVPESLSLLTGDEVQGALVIDNPTAVAMVVTGVDVLAPPRVVASVEGLDLPATIAARSSVSADVTVRTSTELKDAEVGIAVRFRGPAKGSPERSSATSVAVSAASPAAPTLTFLLAPDALNDGEARVTTVRIDNPSGRELTNLSLAALNGDDVSISMKGEPVKPFAQCTDGVSLVCLPTLPAGTSATVNLETHAAESVRTGSQTVGLVLTSTPGEGSPDVTTTATHNVTISVFGVDALSPFGIGALFLFPGLIAVVCFLLGNALYPRTKSLPDQADLKDLRQMPAVVVISAAAYLLVFALFGSDLSRAVSTKGVALLLTAGAAIGVVAWAVMALFYRSIVGTRIFQLDDSPRQVLSRLVARHATLDLPLFLAGGAQYARLGPAAEGKVYGAPRIAFRFSEAAQDQAQDQARGELLAQIGRGEVEPVLAAEKRGWLDLHWVEPAGVRTFDDAAAIATDNGNILKQQT
jgi:hypothetical protein